MLDKKIILAPAKLNIFLKVLGKRNDGYHEIRSGITFVNLFDQIEIEHDHKTTISYHGYFKSKEKIYDDCIIKKTLNFLNISQKVKLKIKIIKNIPVRGGLGSASTNAAALISVLQNMNLIEKRKPEYYASLGADIPCFLFKNDCLVTGMGEKIVYYPFPKYFFLLIKPKFNNSTKKMYEKLKIKNQFSGDKFFTDNTGINEEDVENDFERIVINENPEYKKIIDYITSFDQVIFSRMTGSGSCYYAVFNKKNYALNAMSLFKLKFPELWTYVCENNFVNK